MILAHEFIKIIPERIKYLNLICRFKNKIGEWTAYTERWSKDEFSQLHTILKHAHPNNFITQFDTPLTNTLTVVMIEVKEENTNGQH